MSVRVTLRDGTVRKVLDPPPTWGCAGCEGDPLNVYLWKVLLFQGEFANRDAFFKRRLDLWEQALKALRHAAPNLYIPDFDGFVTSIRARKSWDTAVDPWRDLVASVREWIRLYESVPIPATAGVCVDHEQLVTIHTPALICQITDAGVLLVQNEAQTVAAFQPDQWASFDTA